MFLLGIAIILLSAGFMVIALEGQLSVFINIPSLIIILGSLLAVLTATESFKVFCAGLRAVILPKEQITEDMRGRAASLFRLMSKIAGISGGIATIISLVNMLMNLNFSDSSGVVIIGVNIAAALISMFYSLLLIIAVFEPAVFILKKRSAGKKQVR